MKTVDFSALLRFAHDLAEHIGVDLTEPDCDNEPGYLLVRIDGIERNLDPDDGLLPCKHHALQLASQFMLFNSIQDRPGRFTVGDFTWQPVDLATHQQSLDLTKAALARVKGMH